MGQEMLLVSTAKAVAPARQAEISNVLKAEREKDVVIMYKFSCFCVSSVSVVLEKTEKPIVR